MNKNYAKSEKGIDIKQACHKTKQFSEDYTILSVKITNAVNKFHNEFYICVSVHHHSIN